MQSRTIRRRSIVLGARFTNLTVRENCYHRSKTWHVNRKWECEHNIRETGRGGILRQSQRPDRFYAAAVPAVVPVVVVVGEARGRFAHARPYSRSATIARLKILKEYSSNVSYHRIIDFLPMTNSSSVLKLTKIRNQTLNVPTRITTIHFDELNIEHAWYISNLSPLFSYQYSNALCAT